jgi:hypothetical protein
VAVLFFALYLAVAILLDFKYLAFNGDAVSRMANGFYVLYSRDPHLAAIGFVWNPGTSIADIAPLLFYHLWTPLASHMFAASLVSASCMAGVVYQVRCAVFEWGVKRAPRLVLVAILGLNGMIVYYGGNGMSEGLYLFTLVASCRYLLRWLRDDDLASLVYSATALGVCYLARNEAVGAAMLAGVVVAGPDRPHHLRVPVRDRVPGVGSRQLRDHRAAVRAVHLHLRQLVAREALGAPGPACPDPHGRARRLLPGPDASPGARRSCLPGDAPP